MCGVGGGGGGQGKLVKELVKEVGFGEAARGRTLNVDTSTSLYLSVCKWLKLCLQSCHQGRCML